MQGGGQPLAVKRSCQGLYPAVSVSVSYIIQIHYIQFIFLQYIQVTKLHRLNT